MPAFQDLFPLGFLAIFQLIGGMAVGSALRPLLVGRSEVSIGLLVWGLGFGGIPMLIGTALAATSRFPLLALAGPALFLGAMLFGIVLLPWLVEAVGPGVLIVLGLSLLFMFIGVTAGVGMVRQADIGGGLFFGFIFFGVGALLSGIGLRNLLTDRPSGEISGS